MNKRFASVLTFVLFSIGAAASADPVINVGDHGLLPDTPDQQIQLFVSSDVYVDALNFYIQVADGGPEAVGYGLIPPPGIDGPAITAIDLITGTIFEEDNRGQIDARTFIPQYRDATIATSTMEPPFVRVLANGLLATVTLDTTGFTTIGQQWELRLKDTLGDVDTDFVSGAYPFPFDVPTEIHNGTITIVPEPSSIALLLIAAVGMLVVGRVRRAR